MANDVNKTFASLAGFVLLGGVVGALQAGIGSLLLALFACYIMLVATNAIRRGENKAKNR